MKSSYYFIVGLFLLFLVLVGKVILSMRDILNFGSLKMVALIFFAFVSNYFGIFLLRFNLKFRLVIVSELIISLLMAISIYILDRFIFYPKYYDFYYALASGIIFFSLMFFSSFIVYLSLERIKRENKK